MTPRPKHGILDIEAYRPGKATSRSFAQPIKLSANENPLGCSPAARAAYAAAAAALHLYPDSRTSRLRAAIALKHAVEPERLVFGAGSDEIFAMVCQAYLGAGDNVVQGEFGFAAWAIAARAAGGEVRFAEEPRFAASVDTMLASIDERTKIVFLANPANPTGAWLQFAEIERLHGALAPHVLLVLDGAYAECASDLPDYADGLTWSRDKQNVLVTRTFSKVHGLASLRVGWAHGPADVIAALDRIRLPFSVSRAAEASAIAALADDAFVRSSVEHIRNGRVRLTTGLSALDLDVLPSAGNFVTAGFERAPRSAVAVETALAARGILVRGLTNYGMPHWLRISVGTEDEMTKLLAELSVILRRRQSS